jgi:hypothetical protein
VPASFSLFLSLSLSLPFSLSLSLFLSLFLSLSLSLSPPELEAGRLGTLSGKEGGLADEKTLQTGPPVAARSAGKVGQPTEQGML